jgi:hypothetical protein
MNLPTTNNESADLNFSLADLAQKISLSEIVVFIIYTNFKIKSFIKKTDIKSNLNPNR